MAISYNWQIVTMDRLTSDGFVTCAHWRATATKDNISVSFYSTSSWKDGEPKIPYENLTEADVLSWVWANGVDKEVTEALLAAQIEAQKNPVSATGVPW